jgi:hypothetical protein
VVTRIYKELTPREVLFAALKAARAEYEAVAKSDDAALVRRKLKAVRLLAVRWYSTYGKAIAVNVKEPRTRHGDD